MEEINFEQMLTTAYKRAQQYCKTRYGSEADRLELQDDGSFKAVYGNTCYGEYYEEEHYFGADCLTADLDQVYAERKAEEERQRLQREKEQREREAQRAEQDKLRRKAEYLKLKQEFEPKTNNNAENCGNNGSVLGLGGHSIQGL